MISKMITQPSVTQRKLHSKLQLDICDRQMKIERENPERRRERTDIQTSPFLKTFRLKHLYQSIGQPSFYQEKKPVTCQSQSVQSRLTFYICYFIIILNRSSGVGSQGDSTCVFYRSAALLLRNDIVSQCVYIRSQVISVISLSHYTDKQELIQWWEQLCQCVNIRHIYCISYSMQMIFICTSN